VVTVPRYWSIGRHEAGVLTPLQREQIDQALTMVNSPVARLAIALAGVHAARPTRSRHHPRPTVIRLRAAAKLLHEDIWISVTLPSEYDGDDDLVADEAAARWTTMALHPEDLTWLREALDLNAEDDTDDDEDLEPLD
jgi:hypothetical protein